MTDSSEDVEDERDIELSTIAAIYPELIIDPADHHTITLDLDVAPANGVTLSFSLPPQYRSLDLSSHGRPPLGNSALGEGTAEKPHPETRSSNVQLSYLPPLHVKVQLPDSYPTDKPATVELSTTPPWLPRKVLAILEARSVDIWQECERAQMVYAFIDYLQQQAENCFDIGIGNGDNYLLSHELKTPLINFNDQAKKRKFQQETFDCGVCLEPKRGSACHRLQRCGHVFCVECLQDFFNSAIVEGDVASVKCPAPDCHTNKKNKQCTLRPSELLEIPIKEDKVRRFVDIKLKKKFESDKLTIYCPRRWCQAPARSAKYRKYDAFSSKDSNLAEFPDSSDSETEETLDVERGQNLQHGDGDSGHQNDPARHKPTLDDQLRERLAICSSPPCQYAFCRICYKSWHGDFINCLPSAASSQITAEEKESYNYIRLNTSPCPTCNSPSQKTHGCNHMICAVCQTHFCYLCSSWLDSSNPYRHFNTRGGYCYMRLWELEEGDEGQGNLERDDQDAFMDGPRAAERAAVLAAVMQEEEQLRQQLRAEQPGAVNTVDSHGRNRRQVTDPLRENREPNNRALQRLMNMTL